jgi:hypothetical protein
VGAAAGAAYLVQQANKGDDDSKSETPAIQNNGGTVIITGRDGDVNYSSQQGGGEE